MLGGLRRRFTGYENRDILVHMRDGAGACGHVSRRAERNESSSRIVVRFLLAIESSLPRAYDAGVQYNGCKVYVSFRVWQCPCMYTHDTKEDYQPHFPAQPLSPVGGWGSILFFKSLNSFTIFSYILSSIMMSMAENANPFALTRHSSNACSVPAAV